MKKNNNKLPNGTRIIFIVYILIVALISLVPLSGLNISLSKIMVLGLIRLDILLHVAIFVPFVPLWKTYRPSHSFWFVAISGLMIGAFAEGVHCILPYRSFDLYDLLGNIAGVVTGALVLLVTD